MADSYDDGLGYGHLGDPTYEADDGDWIWKRSLGNVRVESLGQPQVAIASPSDESNHEDSSSISADQQSRDPHLVSIASVVPPLNRISKDVVTALDRHDPMLGDLLAFGHVTDKLNNVVQAVAAFPMNTTRTELCIMRKHNQRQGWGFERHCYILVPAIAGEYGHWTAPSPIQQIVFCQGPSYHKGILAVRTAQATFLLRARLSQSLSLNSSNANAGRLKISVLCVIPSGYTGMPMHAHASLNPWFASHFATVDLAGGWKVWEADSRLDPNGVQDTKEIASGSLEYPDGDAGAALPRTHHDGWLRALWIRDTDTLIICTRTSMVLVDIPSNACIRTSLENSTKRTSPWILDVQPDPGHADRAFVLTTAFVYYFSVGKFESTKFEVRSSSLHILHKIRHFRDHQDPSLHLVLCHDDTSCLVHVSSRMSSVSTRYVFRDDETTDGKACVVSDPDLLSRLAHSTVTGVLCSSMHSAKWDDIPGSDYAGEAVLYRDRGVQFFLSISLHRDMSVTQQLVAFIPAEKDRQFVVHPPRWRNKIRSTANQIARVPFIDEEDEEERRGRNALTVPSRLDRQSGMDTSRQANVNYERIYQHLAEPRGLRGSDLVAIVSRIQDEMQTTGQSLQQTRLLSDFVETELNVGDLDQAADAFQDLVTQHADDQDNSNDLVISHIPGAELAGRGDRSPDTSDLKRLYQDIVSRYLSPLSGEVPGRVRLAREQLARRIAATICLASYNIRAKSTPPEQPAPPSSPPLPSPSQPFSSQPFSSQPFSSQPFSSQPFSSQQPLQQQQPYTATRTTASPLSALSRLQAYTTSHPPDPNLNPLPAPNTATTRILSHWDPSGSPETYSWLATRSRLAAQATAAEETANMSAKELQRLERRKQRLEQRKRREGERLASQLSQGGMAPVLALSQDVGPPGGRAGGRRGPETGTSGAAGGGSSQRDGAGYARDAAPGSGFRSSQARTPARAAATQGGTEPEGNQLAIRSSPVRPSPSQLLSPAMTRSPSVGFGRGAPGETSSQGITMGSQGWGASSQVARGEMGPPPRKKKRRTEGF